ncbi:DUF6876 family protein [Bradyrhizobium paxllaeri]|uniref:DUF6876 family protein n=1 Tax=Bradyrhizobium paxllaeri TaxID=190148 RepID=UPI000810ABA2|nr:DUF6876 family protein [Bradyrhizobium paxllaeri]
MTTKITERDLAQFTGTEQWYRHSLIRSVLYTDGVKYLAEKASAYWLIDKIATLQTLRKIGAEPFQVWKLELLPAGHRAKLTCADGGKAENAGKAVTLYSEVIEFTDFPLEKVELWVEGGVILLPSEH